MVTETPTQSDALPAQAVVEQPAVISVPTPVGIEETPPVSTAPVVEQPATPVAAAPTPTPTPPVPAVAPEVQEYIKRLEQQNQTAQVQEETRVLQGAVAQYAQRLAGEAAVEYGITAEQALPFVQKIANQQGDFAHQQYQAERFRQGQIEAAFQIAAENGADQRSLQIFRSIMNLPSPDAMKAAIGQNKLASENATLKAEIERMKKAGVPAQAFASGAVGGDGGKPTKDNIDALYLKDPDRYSAVYRKFLATGEIS